ncbi:MAG: Hpt domain-containing protein [Alphaproteobacteria bacterium]|nr:Hpt domain-containing protein [Alphaproteobacteria bacterium]
MEQPINFDNLRTITDGDPVLESELFQVFLESSQTCLKGLQAACDVNDEGAWRREAHAFKGLCLNLGAEPLAVLCKTAQEDCGALPDEKQAMLVAMKSELARVQEIIASRL